MRKFRNIPALVTLLAGFVSSVVMIIQKYSLVHFLWVLVAVMAGFYMAGLLLRVILNKAFKDLETEEEKPSEDEGTAGEGDGNAGTDRRRTAGRKVIFRSSLIK